MTPIRAASLAVTPWKNGAGRKADIAAGDGWTVGYAWLDGDAPFSDYAGNDRTITLLEGPGFVLEDAAGLAIVRVPALYRPAAFDGGARLACRVAGGPCRVANVMTERARFRHTVEIVDAGAHETAAPGVVRVLVALTDGMALPGCALARFDAAVLDEARPVDLAGPGRAILFDIVPTTGL